MELSRLTDRQRTRVKETIIGAIEEEDRNRVCSDIRTEEDFVKLRQDLREMSDDELYDMWMQWVGEWIGSRDEYEDVQEQWRKTVNGNEDYGFI